MNTEWSCKKVLGQALGLADEFESVVVIAQMKGIGTIYTSKCVLSEADLLNLLGRALAGVARDVNG